MSRVVYNYNKDNNLIEFIEFGKNDSIERLYRITKNNFVKYWHKTKTTDIQVYEVPIKLSCLMCAGEYWVRPVISSLKNFTYPRKTFSLTFSNSLITSCSVAQDQISNWSGLINKE